MGGKPPSDRRQIADRFAEFIITNDIANPFGGDVQQSRDKRSYGIGMSRPRLLSGEVRVYSGRFILIIMEGPLARGGTERVYASEQDAMNFLRLLLVEHKPDEALAVPTKPVVAKRAAS